MKIEEIVRSIAEGIGCSYVYESRLSANLVFDEFRRDDESEELVHPDGYTFPLLHFLQVTDGTLKVSEATGQIRDASQCVISFADAMPYQAEGRDTIPIVQRLADKAIEFVGAVNRCPLLMPISGDVRYEVAYDREDANLCIITISLTLEQSVGVCPSHC